MIYEYEMACREAMKNGMTQEQYREIYNMFNAEYQREDRQKRARRQSPYEFLPVEGMRLPNGEFMVREIEDESVDVENECIHKMELERLDEVLDLLEKDDREFILDYFSGEGAFLKDMAEKYGMTRNQVIGRKRMILRKLKELY